MPEFQDVPDFPRAADDLARIAMGHWGRFSFVRLADSISGRDRERPDDSHPPSGGGSSCSSTDSAVHGSPPWESILAELADWLSFVDHDALALDPSRSRDYEVGAHWALYCENYLEGFHIPFVHPTLADALEWRGYRTELLGQSVVQIGVANAEGPILELPPAHPAFADPAHARRVAGLYLFVFPNLMINAYPWGLSVNVVEPLACDRTRVRFLSYVSDSSKLDDGAGGDVHRVEMEDEAVVESVQRGVRSRFFRRARFSPTQELGVHWFHRKLAAAMSASTETTSPRSR